MRILLLAGLLALCGCQCGFVPVDECEGSRCFNKDGGKDGGSDAGLDGGATDGGRDGGAPSGWCSGEWDGGGVGLCAATTGYVFSGGVCTGQCINRPIVTPAVFEDLPSCLAGCEARCDTSKFDSFPPQPIAPATFCDQLIAYTTVPWLIAAAFPTHDAGCIAAGADNSCHLWKGVLGDAGYSRACQATLIPRVTKVQCQVFVR